MGYPEKPAKGLAEVSEGGAVMYGVRRIAGWSNLVARQAHILKAVLSNPTPATNYRPCDLGFRAVFISGFHFPSVFCCMANNVCFAEQKHTQS